MSTTETDPAFTPHLTIEEAWQRYLDDTRELDINSPDYVEREDIAYVALQRAVSIIRNRNSTSLSVRQ